MAKVVALDGTGRDHKKSRPGGEGGMLGMLISYVRASPLIGCLG